MSIRWLTGLLFAALLPLISIPAAAQEAVRTIGQYDKELGVQYVAAWENDDRWGNGFLVQGGYKVNACRLWSWQCQGIAEFSVVHFHFRSAKARSASPKRGSGAPQGAMVSSLVLRRARAGPSTGPPYGAPLRRLLDLGAPLSGYRHLGRQCASRAE